MSDNAIELLDRVAELEREKAQLTAQLHELAVKLFDKHLSNMTEYATSHKAWSPGQTPRELVLQIDSLAAGLYSLPDEVRKDAIRLQTLLKAMVAAEKNEQFLQQFVAMVQANTHSPSPVGVAKLAIDHCVATFGMPKE